MPRISMCTLLSLLVMSVSATSSVSHSASDSRHVSKRLLGHRAEPKTRLRVCNAYPYSTPLDVALGNERLTDIAMAYKECREFDAKLEHHSRIQFKFGGANAGVFVVSDLPSKDAVLLLVVYRHDAGSTSVAFESHVFSNLLNSQIAVLDTYRGSDQATLRIQDQEDAATDRSEALQFDNVVAVNSGSYEIALVSSEGKLKGRGDLMAQNRESYVVIRCGVEPKEGKAYPDELIIYPRPEQLKNDKSMGSRAQPYALCLGMLVTMFLGSAMN